MPPDTDTFLTEKKTRRERVNCQRAAEHHQAKHGGLNDGESIKAIFLDEHHLSKFEGREYLRSQYLN